MLFRSGQKVIPDPINYERSKESESIHQLIPYVIYSTENPTRITPVSSINPITSAPKLQTSQNLSISPPNPILRSNDFIENILISKEIQNRSVLCTNVLNYNEYKEERNSLLKNNEIHQEQINNDTKIICGHLKTKHSIKKDKTKSRTKKSAFPINDVIFCQKNRKSIIQGRFLKQLRKIVMKKIFLHYLMRYISMFMKRI